MVYKENVNGIMDNGDFSTIRQWLQVLIRPAEEARLALLATACDSKADMKQTCTRSEVTSLATPVFCLGHGFIQTNADISHLRRQVSHNPGAG